MIKILAGGKHLKVTNNYINLMWIDKDSGRCLDLFLVTLTH